MPIVLVIVCTHPGIGTVNLLWTLSSERQALLGWVHPQRNYRKPDPAVLQIQCKGEQNVALMKFSGPGMQKNPGQKCTNITDVLAGFWVGWSPLNRYHSTQALKKINLFLLFSDFYYDSCNFKKRQVFQSRRTKYQRFAAGKHPARGNCSFRFCQLLSNSQVACQNSVKGLWIALQSGSELPLYHRQRMREFGSPQRNSW